jgi:hypothetical protein
VPAMRRWRNACAALICALGCSHGPLWRSAEAQDATVELWGKLAGRYADRNIVAGYDLLNEPIPDGDEHLVALYQRIIRQIRLVDSAHLVFVEGSRFATRFSAFTAPLDANQAYSFHLYTFFGGDPAAATRDYLPLSRAQGLPLWNGEYGENSYEAVGKTVAAFRKAEQEGWMSGSGYWTWKHALPQRAPVLAGFEASQGWKQLIAWAAGSGDAPSREGALAAMDDFLAQARMERCSVDERMAALLKPPPQPPWPGRQGGFVHRDGAALVDGAGRRLQLEGVNLGGWLLWEAWIWGAPLSMFHLEEQSQGTILARLSSLVGPEAARAFEGRVYREVIDEKDVERIAALGFNVMRVPIGARSLSDGGWDALDSLLAAAERSGVYVVLDLHGAPGGQSPYFIADPRLER